MMVIHSPYQRLFQVFPFFTKLPPGQFRSNLGIGFSAQESVEHVTGGKTHDISHHGSQFEIGIFQHFMQSVHQPRAFSQ